MPTQNRIAKSLVFFYSFTTARPKRILIPSYVCINTDPTLNAGHLHLSPQATAGLESLESSNLIGLPL